MGAWEAGDGEAPGRTRSTSSHGRNDFPGLPHHFAPEQARHKLGGQRWPRSVRRIGDGEADASPAGPRRRLEPGHSPRRITSMGHTPAQRRSISVVTLTVMQTAYSPLVSTVSYLVCLCADHICVISGGERSLDRNFLAPAPNGISMTWGWSLLVQHVISDQGWLLNKREGVLECL